jgi:hypothetical protein
MSSCAPSHPRPARRAASCTAKRVTGGACCRGATPVGTDAALRSWHSRNGDEPRRALPAAADVDRFKRRRCRVPSRPRCWPMRRGAWRSFRVERIRRAARPSRRIVARDVLRDEPSSRPPITPSLPRCDPRIPVIRCRRQNAQSPRLPGNLPLDPTPRRRSMHPRRGPCFGYPRATAPRFFLRVHTCLR